MLFATTDTSINATREERMRIGPSGNVGIGTIPNEKLSVDGIIESLPGGGFKLPDGTLLDDAGDLGGGLALPYSSSISASGNAFSVTNTFSGFGIPTALRGEATGMGVAVEGVSTGSAATAIHGKASEGGRAVWGESPHSNGIAGRFENTAGGTALAVTGAAWFDGGDVGIGTTPEAELDIALGPKRVQFRADPDFDHYPEINVTGTGNAVGTLRVRNKIELWPSDDATRGGGLDVRDSSGAIRIVLDAEAGRTTTPVLEITGGSDLSEQFDIATEKQEVKAGTVVCIDPLNPGQLAVCRKAYDRTVAGVISGAGGVTPGMLMGQKGTAADGAHPVALSGRVYVHCDASNGAIQPGDLLTSSNTPGHAMKVTDFAKAQGAIIGKAMSSLAEGKGLVLVLVSLQ